MRISLASRLFFSGTPLSSWPYRAPRPEWACRVGQISQGCWQIFDKSLIIDRTDPPAPTSPTLLSLPHLAALFLFYTFDPGPPASAAPLCTCRK